MRRLLSITLTVSICLASWPAGAALVPEPPPDEGTKIAPAAVAAAAAAIAAALKVVDGLATWVDNESSACKAACYGMAYGKCCGTTEKDEQDAGFMSALAILDPAADNAGGHGYGSGLAQRSLIGDHYVNPFAIAWKKALPPPPEDDAHAAIGWGRANVKGTGKGWKETTPLASPSQNSFLSGDIYLDVSVGSFSVSTLNYAPGTSASSTSTWAIDEYVDGARVFHSAGSLDQLGQVIVEGDIPSSYFVPIYNSTDGIWGMSFESYNQQVYLGHLNGGEERNFAIEGEGYMTAADSGAIPEPTSLVLAVVGIVAGTRSGARRS